MRIACFILFSCMLLNQLYAQKQDKQVVFSPNFQNQKIKNLAEQIKVIDHIQIKMSGAINLAELISQEFLFSTIYQAKYGQDMLLMGSQKNAIKVLIDGMPYRTYRIDKIDFSDIFLFNINRIEIILNANMVNYGDNALAIINLISNNLPSKSISFQIQNIISSQFQNGVNLQINKYHKKHHFEISYFNLKNNGRNIFDSLGIKTIIPSQKNQFNFGYSYMFKNGFNFKNKIIYHNGNKQDIAYNIPNTNRYYERLIKSNHMEYQASLSGKLSKIHGFLTQFRILDYDRNNQYFLKDRASGLKIIQSDTSIDDSIKYRSWFGRFVFLKNDNTQKINYVSGIDFEFLSDLHKNNIENRDENNKLYCLFSNLIFDNNRQLIANIGLRLKFTNDYKTLPSLNASVQYKFNTKVILKVTASNSAKAPNFNELYGGYISKTNTLIKNLTIREENISHFSYALISKNGKFEFTPRLIYSFVDNKIRLVEDSLIPNNFKFINIGKAKILATTFNFKYLGKQLEIESNFSNTGNNFIADIYGSYFFYQEFYSKITFMPMQYGHKLYLIYKFISKKEFTDLDKDLNPVFYTYNSINMLDFSYMYHLKSPNLQLVIGVRNVLNQNILTQSLSDYNLLEGEPYYKSNIVGNFPRQFFVSFSIQF